MALLKRSSRGFVISDSFSSSELNPMWQISPSDDKRFSVKERTGYLRLKHGEPDVMALMTLPHFDFVFEIDTQYVPLRASDQGGIVVYRDEDTRIELLEYYDPEKGNAKGYDRLRVVRESDMYSGYGSSDGGLSWELVGASFMNASKIGIILHGIQESQSQPLDIDGMRLYRSTKIQVGGISEGVVAKLKRENGTLVKEATCEKDKDFVSIDVGNLTMPFIGVIQIVDKSGMILGETELMDDMWGGDIFTYGISLDLEIDGLNLRMDREYQLGNMKDGLIERKAFVINKNNVTIPSLVIGVQSFNEHRGWEWVDIAEDIFGEPSRYRDSLNVGNIQPDERIPFWIKITRQSGAIASLSDYKFRIVFESGG